jgi:hypothetical protein
MNSEPKYGREVNIPLTIYNNCAKPKYLGEEN